MKPRFERSSGEADPRLVIRDSRASVIDPDRDVLHVAPQRLDDVLRAMPVDGEVIDLRAPDDVRVLPGVAPGAPAPVHAVVVTSSRGTRELVVQRILRRAVPAVPLTVVLALATFFRFWRLGDVGYNSDEAVYAGTAASMAGHTEYSGLFPVFRAHPLLFQTIVSLLYRSGVSDWGGRALAALAGVAAVGVIYAVGRRLYGPLIGSIAGLLLAVMPYHVVVSRQVLLDGPMTLLATVTLYCLVRYCEQADWRWMLATGGALGLTVLTKETSAILLGSIYAFLALTPAIRLRFKHLAGGLAVLIALFAVFPVVVRLSGRASTGNSYLLWQLGRRANHPALFYLDVVPAAVGFVTLIAVVLSLVLLRGDLNSWRERLLLAWIAVPVSFFTLWPLKGYQYLLPIAPALAVLAARGIVALYWLPIFRAPHRVVWRQVAVISATLLAACSLAVPAWGLVNPSSSGTFLAGTGGVPGGREAGLWLAENAPEGSQLLSIGPSMANILQFYSQRRTFGLSVSSNPRDRNPSYQPVANPDLWVREGRVQYVVWDSYTANRSPFFASKVTSLVSKYQGVAVFTATVPVRTPSGERSRNPVVIIYQVGPA